jgi:hypothetical protein
MVTVAIIIFVFLFLGAIVAGVLRAILSASKRQEMGIGDENYDS